MRQFKPERIAEGARVREHTAETRFGHAILDNAALNDLLRKNGWLLPDDGSLDAYGVSHALLVGPNSGYGTDGSPLLDAIRRGAGRFKGNAVVANDTSANDTLFAISCPTTYRINHSKDRQVRNSGEYRGEKQMLTADRFGRLLAVAWLSLAACLAFGADDAVAQTKKIIRINHAGADDILGTEHQMFAWVFANYVNSKSPTLDVRLFPNSGLGQSRQVIEAMQLGSGASMHVGGMAEFANFCKAKCGVIGLPFIFTGYDHVGRVLDGPVGAELSQELEAIGFKVLGYLYSWGYRNVVTSKKEIKSVADLKGLKIRTIPTPVFVGAVNAMGASATPMNFGEVYTSMQSGVLDGYEHTASTTASFKFYEIAKYYALTQHLIDPTVVAFSVPEWTKLDAKEQAVVMEGAKLATDIARAMSSVREAESMAELQKRGMTITRPDMTEARKAASTFQQEMAAKLKAEHLLKQILAQQ